ncbi:MAG: HAMP domain-containing histidine kinase [Oscillospiraceae bacterium]|nr:HAMP domain-containing histidine kinase [Oscillospiraceae bacterium]
MRSGTKINIKAFWLFSGIVFAALVINTFITGTIIYFLVESGIIIVSEEIETDAGRLIFHHAIFSVVFGIFISLAVTKIPFKPIRKLIDGMDGLAAGDFKTRLGFDGVMDKAPVFSEITESFNKMAQQLENTEMLRSDFINNFSHEFKTPIVSIAGFAKVLKKGNLSSEQQKEYLEIIESESMRLSAMATNVLNLTKVENQTILEETSVYNLSEQIRSCMLLLENKWSGKDIDFQLDFGEHNICANEELLKQVWINLLDNAIKFTPEKNTIQVRICEQGENLLVSVMNTGSEITLAQQEKVFNKFYQADESHSTAGNGIGLAVAKKIVELHKGQISVHSEKMITVFTAKLPKNI